MPGAGSVLARLRRERHSRTRTAAACQTQSEPAQLVQEVRTHARTRPATHPPPARLPNGAGAWRAVRALGPGGCRKVGCMAGVSRCAALCVLIDGRT